MSNDTPSWSGDDAGTAPPPPPPSSSPPPPPPPPPPSDSGATDRPAESWGAGAAPDTVAPDTAGLGKRFLARIIDGLIVAIPLGIILFAMGVDTTGFVYALVSAVASLAYFVLLESSQGATLGKRMLGMSVASTQGAKLTTEQAFKRNWWLLLSIIPFQIGSLASLAVAIYIAVTISSDPQNRGFHDKMGDAMVLES